jgi:hypothetical protein
MSPSKSNWFTVSMTAFGIAIGAAGVALADFGLSGPGSQLGMPQYMRAESKALATLDDGEGVFVNKSTFGLHLGKPKTALTEAALDKAGQQVSNGAVIVRKGGKLYLVDAVPGQ